ncbi:unnamed protein product [Rotaria sp. Silwood2]|nr:unnamed protein product [Rotaria sp. Silwood2]CAF4629525.1 unnamed protein product [Rotaria sp. Silwood2]CAF4643231.1 unnamed protein product [Rotaria sp. Silwood2]
MLNRFIDYPTVTESMTILHRSVIVRNVLSKIYEACQWLSGKHYQTLPIVYVIKRGLYHVITQPSSSPQAKIENIIKKYLLIAVKYHFDEKLSVEQKETILES